MRLFGKKVKTEFYWRPLALLAAHPDSYAKARIPASDFTFKDVRLPAAAHIEISGRNKKNVLSIQVAKQGWFTGNVVFNHQKICPKIIKTTDNFNCFFNSVILTTHTIEGCRIQYLTPAIGRNNSKDTIPQTQDTQRTANIIGILAGIVFN